MINKQFPPHFFWGGATAANQFERGWNQGGKGPSCSDFMTSGTHTSATQSTPLLTADVMMMSACTVLDNVELN